MNHCDILYLEFKPFLLFPSPIAGSDPQIHRAPRSPRSRAGGGAAAGGDDSIHVSGFLYDHADARPGGDVLQTHL